jgi:hypothetical protein
MHLAVRGILLSVSLLTASVANAAIYQCTDSNGGKLFQDTPCSAGQKPIEVRSGSSSPTKTRETKTPEARASSPSAGASELVEGRWEITTQKLTGDSLQPEGPPQKAKECISRGWLQRQASSMKNMSALGGGDCKEISSELTDTRWRASVQCDSKEGTLTIEQEFVFEGKSMRGESRARSTSSGKEARETHEVRRVTGQWLGPC